MTQMAFKHKVAPASLGIILKQILNFLMNLEFIIQMKWVKNYKALRVNFLKDLAVKKVKKFGFHLVKKKSFFKMKEKIN